MIDQGDYRGAERTCDHVLGDKVALVEDLEEKARFEELLKQASKLASLTGRLLKLAEEGWIHQSLSFWAEMRRTRPDDKEVAESWRFVHGRNHHFLTERHTKRLRSDARAGFETPS